MTSKAIALVIGVAFAFYSANLVDVFWISLTPILLLFYFLQLNYRPGYQPTYQLNYQLNYQLILLLPIAFLWSSLILYQSLEKRLDPEFDNSVVRITGVVSDITQVRSRSIRFIIKPDYIENYHRVLPQKIRLSWYQTGIVPAAGERWQLLVRLRRPSGFQNPGGFDYEQWLFVKNIHATGYVRRSPLNQLIESASLFNVDRWRQALLRSIDQHCEQCEFVGLIKALVVGYRGDINTNQQMILTNTGTAHLLAISGLHIGLVAALFFGLGRLVWQRYFYTKNINRLELASAFALAGGLIYAGLAGFSIPTVRAFIMLTVIGASMLMRNNFNLLNSLSIALVVILLVDPLAIGSASLWLSVSALLVIVFAQFRLPKKQPKWQQLITIQLLFSLLLVPINLMIFGQVSFVSFFANLIAIPVVSVLVLPLALVSSLLAALGVFIADWMLLATNGILVLLLAYLDWLSDVALSPHSGGTFSTTQLIFMLIGLTVLLMPRGCPGKKPALFLIVIPLLTPHKMLEHGAYEVTALDVGMGTSIVVQTRHHSLVYDFGPANNKGFSAGEWIVAPFLRQAGIPRPDLMIISHVDQDHSGGFKSFLDDYSSSKLVSGTPLKVQEKFKLPQSVPSCHEYPTWMWDGVYFEFLSAGIDDEHESNNNRSCVLKIKGFHSALLTGDVESGQEARLLSSVQEKLKADFMVAPHHGSATSSTPDFIKAIQPDIVVFTVGKNNRWGFPKPLVVDRYRAQQSQIYRTDLQGAITWHSDAGGYEVSHYRASRPRLWH